MRSARACLLLLLALAGPARAESPAKMLDLITPARRQAAKDFTVPALGGGTVHLGELRGKVVLQAPGSLPNDGKVIEDTRKLV